MILILPSWATSDDQTVYALCLLLYAVHCPGAVPLLVCIVREGSHHRPTNRELAAALLAVLCRSQDVQVDVVASGGIPTLARWVLQVCTGPLV